MIILGSDHAGYELKEKIKKMLDEWNYAYIDVSPEFLTDDDYTDVVETFCKKMNVDSDKAIMVCGTGIGSSIMANKYKANESLASQLVFLSALLSIITIPFISFLFIR